MAFFPGYYSSMAAFQFKQFAVDDHDCGMKIGTDGTLLGAWADCANAASIIDLGAGSGLLALMLAQRCPNAAITAIEIDPDACASATANFAASPWPERVSVICADAAGVDINDIDLIVCNPPYFASTLRSPHAKRATARHADTLSPAAALQLASQWLSPSGSIAMVTPADIEAELVFTASMLRLMPRRLCRVSTVEGKQPSRLLSQWHRLDGPIECSTLAIRTTDNAYTAPYRQLTQPFYLHF